MDFEKFDKIPRYFRDVIITEKIDGSNGQIFIAEQPEDWVYDRDGEPVPPVWSNEYSAIWAGSRNRWVHPEKKKDNHGFARWVLDNAPELMDSLGPGRHYGEWFGSGIARNYGLDHKRFALFNTTRWDYAMWQQFVFLPWDIQREMRENKGKKHQKPMPHFVYPPDCCVVVPVLYAGPWTVLDGIGTPAPVSAMLTLEQHGSFAVKGFDKPEGIVVYHSASNHLFKATFDMDGGKYAKTS